MRRGLGLTAAQVQGIGLFAGFATGLAGSLHCAAACAGISFALAVPAGPGGSLAARFITVQAGRMSAYALAGALVGGGGGALVALLGLAGGNHWLRIGAAAVMAWTGLAVAGVVPSPHQLGAMVPARFAVLVPFHRSASSPHLGFLLGFGWGMMPCGMVYLALMAALFAGGAGWGAAYMIAFFLGTLPALAGTTFGLARGAAKGRASAQLRRPAGVLIVALAVGTLAMPTDMAKLLCAY